MNLTGICLEKYAFKKKKRCGFVVPHSFHCMSEHIVFLFISLSAIVSKGLEEEINLSQQCQQYF